MSFCSLSANCGGSTPFSRTNIAGVAVERGIVGEKRGEHRHAARLLAVGDARDGQVAHAVKTFGPRRILLHVFVDQRLHSSAWRRRDRGDDQLVMRRSGRRAVARACLRLSRRVGALAEVAVVLGDQQCAGRAALRVAGRDPSGSIFVPTAVLLAHWPMRRQSLKAWYADFAWQTRRRELVEHALRRARGAA